MVKNSTRKLLSPRELEVIARLGYEKATVVTQEQFDRYFQFPERVRTKVLFRLKSKGILNTIKRGVYFYSPLEAGPAGKNINEFLIPSVFFPKANYYVGYATMYNFYGFTDQIFQVMHVLNTSLQREKTVGGIKFKMLKIPATRMYGLEKIMIGDAEVIVSDKERTLIDLIYFFNPVGGLSNAFEILKDLVKTEKVNISRLIGYAVKFPNLSTRKRIGFALEQAGVKDPQLGLLLKSVQQSSLVTLYPSKSRSGKINKKWNLIENDS